MKSAPWILGDIQMQFGRNGRSLFYFCTGEGINLLPAEDEDSAVTEKNIMPLLLNAKSSLLMEEEYLSSLHYIADYSLINAHAMKDYIGLYKMRDFLRWYE